MDPRFVAFVQWLFSKGDQTDATGSVAKHVLANGFLPGVLDANANFQPTISVCDGAHIDHPGMMTTGPSQSWVSAPAALAAQALRGATFDWLNVSVRHFGPNVTPAQVSTAIAAWGG